MRAYPPAAPLIADLLAQNLDWPGADQIAEADAGLLPPQLKAPRPEAGTGQGAMMKLVQALQAAKVQDIDAGTDRARDEARKLEIDAFGRKPTGCVAVRDAG